MSHITTFSPYDVEKAKYRKMWDVPDYRVTSFGEQFIGAFLQLTGVRPGMSVVDVGCGTGRASLKMAQLLMDVTMVDMSADALDKEVRESLGGELHLKFIESCLWHSWGLKTGPVDMTYCCDVLEHIPAEFTMLVAAMCVDIADRAFFHINFDPDYFGSKIGEKLHLTVQPFEWWRDRLAELGRLVEARDMLGRGMFLIDRR